MELCREEGESAGGLDSHGRRHSPYHCLPRGRSPPPRAAALWGKIPTGDQEQATFSTDCYEAYKGVIPSAQHQAITKLARKTNHVERFNCTLRPRVSRLVRATLSFSKKLSTHIGALKYFICAYTSPKVQPSLDSTIGYRTSHTRPTVWCAVVMRGGRSVASGSAVCGAGGAGKRTSAVRRAAGVPFSPVRP